jgi:hypothetical protein
MTVPFDTLLQDAATAIAARDARYMEAYSHYVAAEHASINTMIAMVQSQCTDDTIAAYRAAMDDRIRARRTLDEAQVERIAGLAMYAQVVRLMEEELIPKLAEHQHRIVALEDAAQWSNHA